MVLHNERILRGKRNLINVVFVLAFLYLLAIYITLICFMLQLLIKYILLVDNKAIRFETHCMRTHFIGAPCEDRPKGRSPNWCPVSVYTEPKLHQKAF